MAVTSINEAVYGAALSKIAILRIAVGGEKDLTGEGRMCYNNNQEIIIRAEKAPTVVSFGDEYATIS